MPYLLTPARRRRRSKPLGSTRLLDTHPLTRGLWTWIPFNEGSGRAVLDYSGNGVHGTLSTNHTWSYNAAGPSPDANGAGGMTLARSLSMSGLSYSVFYAGVLRAVTNNDGIFRSDTGSGGEFCILQSGTGLPWVRMQATNVLIPGSGAGFPLNRPASILFTIQSGVEVRCYINGRLEHQATTALTTGSGFLDSALGQAGGLAEYMESQHIAFGFWSRVLSATEAAQLHADPFAMHADPPAIPYWWPSAGGTSSTATLTVTMDGFGLTGSATHTGPPARTATLSQTLAAVTLSSAVTFAAAPARTGTLSQTLGSVTVASAVTHTGPAASAATLSQTLGSVTVQAQAGRPLVFLAIPSKVARTHKPTFPTLRNDHPLAQGLAFLTVPTIPGSRNLVDGSRGVLSSEANGGWSTPSLYEAAIESTSTTLGGAYWPFPQRLEGASDFTIAWLGRIDSRALNGKLVALPYRQDTTWSPPFTALAMFVPTQLGVELTDTSATRFESTSLGTVTDGQTRLYAVTRRGTAIRAYRDGDVVATATLGTSSPIKFDALGATVRPNVYVMQRNHQNTGEGVDGLCSMAAIWNRALTDGEIEQLWVEPFAMVRPRPTLLVGSQAIPGSIGSLTATTDAVTLSGAATFAAAPARTGTLSQTLGSVTMTGAATFTAAPARTGTLSQTLGSVTLTSSVTAGAPGTVTGTLTQTLASVSLTSAVTFTGVGGSNATLSATLGSVTFTGAATHTGPPSRTASLSVTLGNVTLVGQIGNPGGSEWRGGSLVATYWAGGTISTTAWTGGSES